MTDSNDQKDDHARAAYPEPLTRAALDYQAEIICLIAIQKSMSEVRLWNSN